MRLGGPIPASASQTPDEWVAALRERGYRAAVCPLRPDADDATVAAYAGAAGRADIVIAEVGAWSNPLSRDDAERRRAIEHCQRSLDLAERIGARCCVNIAGSRGATWDGPDADNLTEATFDMIVETTRAIIDAVRPTRTSYALEPMPWMYPDSPASYLRLIRAIDRPGLGAHLDPVNIIRSPQEYYGNRAVIEACFRLLGPWVRSCHAKDILLHPRLTVHLDEVRPGLGGLDYRAYLAELERLGPDTPLLLEHLPAEEEYRLAAEHVRAVAAEIGVAA